MPVGPVIDALAFSRDRRVEQGVLPVKALPRVCPDLADDTAEVRFRLEGGRDPRGRPALRLGVEASLPVRCQRCLAVMQVEVRAESELLLAADEAEANRLMSDEDETEAIVASRHLAVADLVEDELVLALPYSPRHADGECAALPAEAGREN